MLVLEGPDGVGKSTAAERLKQIVFDLTENQVDIVHMSKPKPGFNFYSDYFQGAKTLQIRDRFHLGEWVYGQAIYGCRTNIDRLELVAARVRAMGGLIVTISADQDRYDELQLAAEAKDPDRKEMFDVEQRRRVNQIYYYLHPMMYDIGIHLGKGEYVSDAFLVGVARMWISSFTEAMRVGAAIV